MTTPSAPTRGPASTRTPTPVPTPTLTPASSCIPAPTRTPTSTSASTRMLNPPSSRRRRGTVAAVLRVRRHPRPVRLRRRGHAVVGCRGRSRVRWRRTRVRCVCRSPRRDRGRRSRLRRDAHWLRHRGQLAPPVHHVVLGLRRAVRAVQRRGLRAVRLQHRVRERVRLVVRRRALRRAVRRVQTDEGRDAPCLCASGRRGTAARARSCAGRSAARTVFLVHNARQLCAPEACCRHGNKKLPDVQQRRVVLRLCSAPSHSDNLF